MGRHSPHLVAQTSEHCLPASVDGLSMLHCHNAHSSNHASWSNSWVLVNERAAASDKCKSANNEMTALKRVFKAARVEGMKGIAIKHRIDATKMKLWMMNQNREFYVSAAANSKEGASEFKKKNQGSY